MKIKDYLINENITKENLIEAGFEYYNKNKLFIRKSLSKNVFLYISIPFSKNNIVLEEIGIYVLEDVFLIYYEPFYRLQENPTIAQEEIKKFCQSYNEKINKQAHIYGILDSSKETFNPNIKDIVRNYNKEMDYLTSKNILESIIKKPKTRVKK